MKKMLLLMFLCFIPAVSNAMFGGLAHAITKSGKTEEFVKNVQEVADQRAAESSKSARKKKIEDANLLDATLMTALDEGHEKTTEVLKQANDHLTERTNHANRVVEQRVTPSPA